MESEGLSLNLPAGWGRLRMLPAGIDGPDRRFFETPQPHARLADGRTVIWEFSGRAGLVWDTGQFAVDAESLGTTIPEHVRNLLGGDVGADSLTRWTRLEVRAKLTGVPVLPLLMRGDPDPGDWAIWTLVWQDAVVSFGGLPTGTEIPGMWQF